MAVDAYGLLLASISSLVVSCLYPLDHDLLSDSVMDASAEIGRGKRIPEHAVALTSDARLFLQQGILLLEKRLFLLVECEVHSWITFSHGFALNSVPLAQFALRKFACAQTRSGVGFFWKSECQPLTGVITVSGVGDLDGATLVWLREETSTSLSPAAASMAKA